MSKLMLSVKRLRSLGSQSSQDHEDLKAAVCQELIKQEPRCHGWLRRKSKLQQIGSNFEQKVGIQRSHSLVNKVSWQQRYVILQNGLLYIFPNETATRAQKVIRTNEYRFFEAGDEKCSSIPWSFVLEPTQPNDSLKSQYFCATTADDLQKWKTAFNTGIANRRRMPIPEETTNRPLASPTAPRTDEDNPCDVYEDPPATIADEAMWSGSPEDARRVLEQNAEEGLFLLRNAVDGSGYTLMVISEGKPCKFRIIENKQTKTLSFMDRLNFDNLNELISHFSNNPLPNKQARLTKPISRCQIDLEYA